MTNPSGIEPLEYYVVIKLDSMDEITKGGVWLPASVREREEQAQVTGRLIAIGPLAFRYDVENSVIPQIGNRVAFPKYGGLVLRGKDGTEYRLLKDGDLAAILAE